MSICDWAERLFTPHRAAPSRTKKCAARIVVSAVLATALLCAGDAKAQQSPDQAGPSATVPPPRTQAEIDNAATLDKLLADHAYNELADRMLKPPDPSLIGPTLNWAKARMMSGTSQIVPLLYAHMLWGIASSSPQLANLKETAGLAVAYALLVVYADGVKCADQTAPQYHFDTIMRRYPAELQFIAQMPTDRKDALFQVAIAMEKQTAPRRQNDNYLCRFGMQEMQDSLEKYPAKEVPDPGPSMHYGKTMAVQNDPNYEPKYLPREEWEPKQVAQRAQFATLLPKIVDRLKNAPASQPPAPQTAPPKP